MRREVFDLLPRSTRVGWWVGRALIAFPFAFVAWSLALAWLHGSQWLWLVLAVGFVWVGTRATWRPTHDAAFIERTRYLDRCLDSAKIDPELLASAWNRHLGESMWIAGLLDKPASEREVWTSGAYLVEVQLGSSRHRSLLLTLTDERGEQDKGTVLLVPPLVLFGGDGAPGLFAHEVVWIGAPIAVPAPEPCDSS